MCLSVFRVVSESHMRIVTSCFAAEFFAEAEGEARVLFSDEVGKINGQGFYQKRNFVITPNYVYNFKGMRSVAT